ncbi:Ribosomal protein S18 acetylase RimI [Paenibacillus sp. 1_12]|nr:Ribosomal protein S18 acetylase RimI [Paenibacillus sp. 1_12]
MIKIRRAKANDSNILAKMVVLLLSDLTGNEIDQEPYMAISSQLLDKSDSFSAFLAFNESDQCIGVITVTECCAIYARGSYGVIQELYVLPNYRSKHIGHELMKEVVCLAKTKGWNRLEVGAPNEDKWERTIQFYEREGFREIGPRLKLVL